MEADQAHLRWRESMRQLARHWHNAAPEHKAQHLSLPTASLAGALSLREAFGDELQQEPLQNNHSGNAANQSTLGDFLNGVNRQAERNRNRTRLRVAIGFAVMAAVATGVTLLWRHAESERQRAVTNLELARQTADSLVEVRKELLELYPDNASWQRDIVVSYWKLASFAESAEQWTDSSGYWAEVISQLKNVQSRNILAKDSQRLAISQLIVNDRYVQQEVGYCFSQTQRRSVSSAVKVSLGKD